jgi:hypothetical protein
VALPRPVSGERCLLFLLNDTVLVISGGLALVQRAGLPMEAVRGFKLSDAIAAMQAALVEIPDLARREPDKAGALCWVLASRSQANAALFVPNVATPKKPADISYRLAQVSITTLGSLHSLQQQGRTTPALVNASVWQARAA